MIESVRIIRLFILGCILAGASLDDLKTMTIPNRLIAAGAAASLLRLAEGDGLMQILMGLIPALGIFILTAVLGFVTGRPSLGMGDIKLIAVIGLHMGVKGTILATGIACIATLIAYPLLRRKNFPFAPMLAAGAGIAAAVQLLV